MLSIKQNQTLPDMAVQHTGSMESLFLLAVLNKKSITTELVPGDSLQDVPVTDKRVTRAFAKIEYDVITIILPPPVPGGIGYMQIGNSFKVS